MKDDIKSLIAILVIFAAMAMFHSHNNLVLVLN